MRATPRAERAAWTPLPTRSTAAAVLGPVILEPTAWRSAPRACAGPRATTASPSVEISALTPKRTPETADLADRLARRTRFVQQGFARRVALALTRTAAARAWT